MPGNPNIPLLWDPIDVARRVKAGRIVHLGKNLVIWKVDLHWFAQKCKRCRIEVRYTRLDIATRMDEFANFLIRHTHEEMPS